jgi:hypothetical protein
VYVYGNSVGVIGRAWRSGSAADRLVASVQSEVVTHADAVRALGTRLLAAQHQQPEIQSLTLPLGLPQFPLARLGDLAVIEFTDGSKVRGLINGVSIDVGRGTTRQTLTLGEDTPNVWALWKKLLPDAPVLWGTVVAVYPDQTRLVDLIGGGRARVRGEEGIGTSVWVRNGLIEGTAPDLPEVDVELF